MRTILSFLCLTFFVLSFAQTTNPPDTVKGHHETNFWGTPTGTVWCDGTGELTCYYTKPEIKKLD